MNSIQIFIPSRVQNNEAGFNWLAQVAHQLDPLWGNHVRFVGKGTSFFEGNLCGPLGALLQRAIDSKNTVSIGDGVSGDVLKVWSKNDFLRQFGGASMNDTFATTLTYQKFPLTQDQKGFAAYVAHQLMSKDLPENMAQAARDRFAHCIVEIFDNAVSHSESTPGVFSCGQYFPSLSRLMFTMTDLGNGFRWNLEQKTNFKFSDENAIAWAVERGNTTRRGGNGGSGLSELREFFARNGGSLQIVSYSGFWEVRGDVEKQSTLRQPFPGSFVNLEINTADTTIYEDQASFAGTQIF